MIRPRCGLLDEHGEGLCDCSGFWSARYAIPARRAIVVAVRAALRQDPGYLAQVTAALDAARACAQSRLGALDDCLACTTCSVYRQLNDRDGLPVVTPWAVICARHGRQYLSAATYEMQLQYPNKPWACPACGRRARWDDEHHETWGYDDDHDTREDHDHGRSDGSGTG